MDLAEGMTSDGQASVKKSHSVKGTCLYLHAVPIDV